MSRRWIVAGVAVGALALASIAAEYGAIAQDRAQDGRRMFMEQGCYGCHTVGKVGTPIGPDLSRVGAKYSEAYLKNWLRDPQQQRPAAHMPKLELTEPQIAALAAFLASLN
jgi:mono/diheme cytochrome c family protein